MTQWARMLTLSFLLTTFPSLCFAYFDANCARDTVLEICYALDGLGVSKQLTSPWASWNISWIHTHHTKKSNSSTLLLTKRINPLLVWIQDTLDNAQHKHSQKKSIRSFKFQQKIENFIEELNNDLWAVQDRDTLSIGIFYKLVENFVYVLSSLHKNSDIGSYDRKIRSLNRIDHEISSPFFIPVPIRGFPSMTEANILRVTPITYLPMIKDPFVLSHTTYTPYTYFRSAFEETKKIIKSDKEWFSSYGKFPSVEIYSIIYHRLMFEEHRIEQFHQRGDMASKERQALETVYYYLTWHALFPALNTREFETALNSLSNIKKESFVNHIIALGRESSGSNVRQTGSGLPTYKIKEMRPLLMEAFGTIESITRYFNIKR